MYVSFEITRIPDRDYMVPPTLAAIITVCMVPALSVADWKLVWSDEFNYTGLPDETKWGYDVGGGGWGNQELQYYTEKEE